MQARIQRNWTPQALVGLCKTVCQAVPQKFKYRITFTQKSYSNINT